VPDNQNNVVAIVANDRGFRESLKFMLEASGRKVVTFVSAEAFLASPRWVRPACLIADQNMLHMKGLELAAQLLREDAKIPFLLITGAPSPTISSMASQLGIQAVIGKPVGVDRLLEFVKLQV
jgi:FixJ family two-component response regulator